MANPGGLDAGSVTVRLGADVRQEQFDAYDKAVERARRHRAVETELGGHVDKAAFAEYDRALDRAREKAKDRQAFKAALGADYDRRAFDAYHRAIEKARRERDVTTHLKVEADGGGFGGWIRNLRTARGAADDANRSHRSLGQTLRGIGWGALITGIGPVIAGLGALAAAAVEAVAGLSPLVGVLATLPQFAAAAGQGLGVLALAGTGVVQTLKAMMAVDKGAAQAAQSGASTRRSAAASITSAQRSVADATRGVHDAQLQLTDAERQALFARQDLTKAEKDAGEQLKQLKFQAQDAALAEAGASLTLAEARDHLRQVQEDPHATAFDIADAQRQLAEAKQARVEAIDQSKTTQKTFDEAKRKGKDQLPDVVSARRQYQAAERSVQSAVKGVTQAETQQRRATQDLARAQADATAGAAKHTAAQSEYQRQLKQLDPAARAFVLRLKELQGTGLSLTHAAQSGFFPGALKGLNSALPLLGRAKTAIHDTAGVLGNLTAQAGKFLGSRGFGRDFSQITKENAVLIDRAGQAGGHLFKALVNLTIAAQPLTDWISRLVLGWTKSIDAMTAAGRQSGQLAKFFRETRHVIQDVVSIVGDLGGALVGVFKAAYPFGRAILDGLTKSAGRLNDLVNSAKGQNALTDFFRNAQRPLHELWLGLGDLAKAIGSLFTKQLFDAMATILHALRVDVIPALASIARVLGTTVVPAAAKAIAAVARLLKDLAPGLKPLFDVLGTLLDVFTSVVKFMDKITHGLPGVLKLLPALTLAGVSWLGWKTLLGFIATAKTRTLELIGLEQAAAHGPGGVPIGGVPVGRGPRGLPPPVPGTRVGGPAVAVRGAGSRLTSFIPAAGASLLSSPGALGLAGAASAFGQFKIAEFQSRKLGTLGDILGLASPAGLVGVAKAHGALDLVKGDFKGIHDWILKTNPSLDALNRRISQFGGKDLFTKDQIKALKDTRAAANDLQANFGFLRNKSAIDLKQLNQVVVKNMQDINTAMGIHSLAGQKAVSKNFRLAVSNVKQMMHDGQISTSKGMKEIKLLMDANSLAGSKAVADNIGIFVRAVRDAMSKGGKITKQGLEYIHGAYVKEAQSFGLSKPAALQLADVKLLQTQGVNPGGRAMGGWIGQPGERGGDDVPLALPPEWAIINGPQQSILSRGLQMLGLDGFARGGFRRRFAEGGLVPIMAGRGEYAAGPDEQPLLDMAARVAGFGGLAELFSNVTRPHYLAAGGYVYPMGSGLHLGRTDMGVDFSGSGNIATIGDAYFTRVASQHSGTGWPGAGDGGTGNNGAMMVYRLKNGPRAGRYVYLAENVDPMRGLHSGVTLGAGTPFAHARGAFPFLETGWAADAHGTTLSVAHGTQNRHPNHSNTPEGLDFLAFLGGLQHGKILGGLKGGLALATAAVFKAIKGPQLKGQDSLLKYVVQGAFDKSTSGANSKLKKLAGSATTPTGAPSFGPASGSWMSQLRKIAKQRGWSVSDWLSIIQPESSGNPNARNGQYYGLGQLSASAQRTYGGGPGSSPAQEIVAMARYIQARYRNPTAALSWRRAHNWYNEGGFIGGAGATAKAGVRAAASSSARLQRAINAAEVFWSHTRGFNYHTPQNRRHRIHWGNPSGSFTGETTGTPGSHSPSRQVIISTGRKTAPWGVLDRTVTHEYGHMLGYQHQGGASNIMMGGTPPAGRYPWTAKYGEGWANSHSWGTRGPALFGIPIPLDKIPAWFKGGTPSGGSPGSPSTGSTGPVSASGRKSYVDKNFVTWRYPTQQELNEWYGKAKTGTKKSSGRGARGPSSHHRGTHSIWPAGAYSGLAAAHGVRGHRATIAGAIAMAETAPHGFFASVGDGGQSHGPWQVYHPAHPQYSVSRLMNDPDYTANAMAQISGHGSNWRPWSTYNNGAYRAFMSAAARHIPWKARGGFLGRAVRRFAGGGFVSPAFGAYLTSGAQGTGFATGGGRRRPTNQANIPIANMGSAERHWAPGITKWTKEAAKWERAYSRRERQITRDDSRLEYVTSPADGSAAHVNQAAIKQRTGHLNELIELKQKITHAYWKLRQAIESLRKAYRETIAKLRKQLKFITSKLRRTSVESQIKTYEGRKNELTDLWQQADDNWWSAGQDKLDLIGERDVLAPDAAKQVTDAGPGADQQAILDQAKARIAVLEEATRINEGTIAAFRSPGDIGIGAPNAYAAAYDLPGVGQGNVWGGAAAPYGVSPYAPGAAGGPSLTAGVVGPESLGGLAPGMYVLKIDDPAGQKIIAAAGNAGNGYQGYQQSSLEIPGL